MILISVQGSYSINIFLNKIKGTMLTLQSKGIKLHKGHSKTNSTDTLYTQGRRRFLTVVSAEVFKEKSLVVVEKPAIKTVAQLKQKAMGRRTMRMNSDFVGDSFDSKERSRPSMNVTMRNGEK